MVRLQPCKWQRGAVLNSSLASTVSTLTLQGRIVSVLVILSNSLCTGQTLRPFPVTAPLQLLDCESFTHAVTRHLCGAAAVNYSAENCLDAPPLSFLWHHVDHLQPRAAHQGQGVWLVAI